MLHLLLTESAILTYFLWLLSRNRLFPDFLCVENNSNLTTILVFVDCAYLILYSDSIKQSFTYILFLPDPRLLPCRWKSEVIHTWLQFTFSFSVSCYVKTKIIVKFVQKTTLPNYNFNICSSEKLCQEIKL